MFHCHTTSLFHFPLAVCLSQSLFTSHLLPRLLLPSRLFRLRRFLSPPRSPLRHRYGCVVSLFPPVILSSFLLMLGAFHYHTPPSLRCLCPISYDPFRHFLLVLAIVSLPRLARPCLMRLRRFSLLREFFYCLLVRGSSTSPPLFLM